MKVTREEIKINNIIGTPTGNTAIKEKGPSVTSLADLNL